MKHANIVSYQESFEGCCIYMTIIVIFTEYGFTEGGKLHIAMDYCDGGYFICLLPVKYNPVTP